MRIDLDVPYSDKDKVKALGGKWDMSTRKWYVLDPSDLKPFVQWMSTDVKAFYRNNNV
jgi:hypothetical protein